MKTRRLCKYNSPTVPVKYRRPIDVEAALTRVSVSTGRSKTEIVVQALELILPGHLNPLSPPPLIAQAA